MVIPQVIRRRSSRCPGSYFWDTQEQLRHAGIKMASFLFVDVVARLGRRPGGAVGAVGSQGVPDIDDGKDTGRQGNLFLAQAARVAAAVPLLVMAVGNIQRLA